MEEIRIQDNDANQRVDKFLSKMYPNLSKSLMYKSIRKKKIKVNRKRCEANQKLMVNDTIQLFLPPDVLIKRLQVIPNVKADIDVVFEDEQILVVNKPRGLKSQPDTNDSHEDCLIHRVIRYLYETDSYSLEEQSFTPALCHRLDRNTMGLVIAAKSAHALRVLNEAIANRVIEKEYIALVDGVITQSKSLHLYMKKEETKALVLGLSRTRICRG